MFGEQMIQASMISSSSVEITDNKSLIEYLLLIPKHNGVTGNHLFNFNKLNIYVALNFDLIKTAQIKQVLI